MSRESLIILFGSVVFLTAFSGVPGSWKQIIFSVCGALTVVVGYQLRRRAYIRSIEQDDGVRRTDMFEESAKREEEVTNGEDQS